MKKLKTRNIGAYKFRLKYVPLQIVFLQLYNCLFWKAPLKLFYGFMLFCS